MLILFVDKGAIVIHATVGAGKGHERIGMLVFIFRTDYRIAAHEPGCLIVAAHQGIAVLQRICALPVDDKISVTIPAGFQHLAAVIETNHPQQAIVGIAELYFFDFAGVVVSGLQQLYFQVVQFFKVACKSIGAVTAAVWVARPDGYRALLAEKGQGQA